MSTLKRFGVGADLCMCYNDKLQSEVEENVFKEGAYKKYDRLTDLGYNDITKVESLLISFVENNRK